MLPARGPGVELPEKVRAWSSSGVHFEASESVEPMKKSVCAGILVLAAACPVVFAQPAKPPVEVRPTQTQVVRAPSAARLANADQVRRQLGLVPEFANVPGIESIKIAVL